MLSQPIVELIFSRIQALDILHVGICRERRVFVDWSHAERGWNKHERFEVEKFFRK